MFEKFNAHCRKLLDAGIITPNEFWRATFLQHYRTLEEFKVPFDDGQSPVLKSGLRLSSISTHLTPCP